MDIEVLQRISTTGYEIVDCSEYVSQGKVRESSIECKPSQAAVYALMPVASTEARVGGESAYTVRSIVLDSRLYEKFANLDFNKDGGKAIVKFCNRWGLLGLDRVYVDAPYHRPRGQVRHYFECEPLWAWVDDITQMKLCLEVWNALRSNGSQVLNKYVSSWKDYFDQWKIYFNESLNNQDNGESWTPAEIGLCSCEYETSADFWNLLQELKGGPVKPALEVLRQKVNANLMGHVSPVVKWQPGYKVLELSDMVPRTLHGALWLQFALTITGREHEPRLCWCGCGRSLEGKRAGARFYHSSNCRKRYDRQQAQKAIVVTKGGTDD